MTYKDDASFIRRMMPIFVVVTIVLILAAYATDQRKNVVRNAEQVAEEMAEYVASSVGSEIDYAESSIRLAAVTISQTMSSDTLENPSDVILPMIANTPFGSIEYIRPDGMNVMNIGEPFDASDRVYYIEGIKGNTGIWNNYHPKTSQETLMNFYTPLMYDGKIAGVITGYIAANTQIAPILETSLYDKPIYGLVLDESNMVICSTVESDYVKDQTIDMFMDGLNIDDEQKGQIAGALSQPVEKTEMFKDESGEGRLCVTNIPGTSFRVAMLIPSSSFDAIIADNMKDAVVAVVAIAGILILYAAFVLIRNIKRRKELIQANSILEEENRIFDEENQRVFAEISEIRDIIASADMGTWKIEIVDGEEPRMYADSTMKSLLGISDLEATPQEIYSKWFERIKPDAIESVLRSVQRMEEGYFDENTYLWLHPEKGERYVRCGGTAQPIPGGFSLRGYHYDVDDVVREDQAKVVMLQNALDEKDEYYSTLGALGDIYYSMHVVDIPNDTVTAFAARNNVKELVADKFGAKDMMNKVMNVNISDAYRADALEFCDLSTVPDRMQNKKIISRQFLGTHIGWINVSFIMLESDEAGRPVKVIVTTRDIDEEKKQEEQLIRKSQTDELTGLLNRRAYEEDIYEHNDIPEEEHFIYVSLDVNGLKVVNDTMGHTAGDELLVGACYCMKKSLGPYGRVYRTGGDEFVAILFCDEQKVTEVFADFDDTISKWSGHIVDSLSISYGWTSKTEYPGRSVRQLGIIAEERMYEAKADHYKKTGTDRRGQQDAHKALCGLYAKILKVNLTDDTYQIINMDEAERTEDKGFADKISTWLKTFGTSGQVHPDDLQEYLEKTDISYIEDYFRSGKTSLHIFYRRKYGDIYKQVMMEMIPASDYSDQHHSLYLYVKDIDR